MVRLLLVKDDWEGRRRNQELWWSALASGRSVVGEVLALVEADMMLVARRWDPPRMEELVLQWQLVSE